MADSEHNDFFEALDNDKEHAADMAAMEDDAKRRRHWHGAYSYTDMDCPHCKQARA